MQIVATRKFWRDGALVAIGARLELPDAEARALITAGKAESAIVEVSAPDQPATSKENDYASETTQADEIKGAEDVQSVD